jgi:hypothetical protein
VTCALCSYYEAQYHRVLAEMLELRLQVVDGPRVRVRELEDTVERLNRKIAELNRRKAS